ncbi:MAG: AzlD domain-containing protein [Ruminococcaceae bacterium]|nr:AzlD domain-containing protein [Oscillospiraceae bacterium]
MNNFFIYLLTMAGVTYLVRMIPLVLVKKKITNRYIISFLHYIPYAVLTVMTVPGIFYSTSYSVSAIVGFVVAVLFAFMEKTLVIVAAMSCFAVFACEMALNLL